MAGSRIGHSLADGIRPHLLYGSKEHDDRCEPPLLPPLLGEHLARYPPEKGGMLPDNRSVVVSLASSARKWIGQKIGKLQSPIRG